MVLVVFIILELLILAKDSSIFTKNILSKIFFLFDSLNFTNRHIYFLVNYNMELFFLVRNVSSKENIKSHFHILFILAVNFFDK